MVVVNVHFELDLALRDLRERLRFISLYWPHYSEAFGVIIGDFNVCEPEEGRFSVWNQTVTEGHTDRTAVLRSLKLRSLGSQGRILLLMVRCAHCP